MTVKTLTLGVAVIGAGIGEQHVRSYLANEHCQLRWVYDLDPARSQRLIAQWGQGAVASGLEQVLQDPEVQVVSIASYDDAHFEQTLAALGAGKHLFVEKPLCRSMGELKAIQAAWQAGGGSLHLASNLLLRRAPAYRWLKQAIETGALGEIYAFDGDYLYGRIEKITSGWRKEVENYSVILGGGVHLVDLMLWLTRQKPVSVTTVGNRLCTQATAFRYHDYMAATFQFPSGMAGRVTANFGCVQPHQHVVRLFGTKATFLLDDQGPRLYTDRDPRVLARPLDLSALPVSEGDLIPDFIQAIIEEADTKAQTQHEFNLISACVAADRAVATASSVPIEYV